MVEVHDARRMNLLGLMMADLLEARIARPVGRDLLAKLCGTVVVRGGSMTITLNFARGRVSIERGDRTASDGRRADASIRGTLAAMLDVACGELPVGAVLGGRLRVAGHPLLLWRLRALLGTPPTARSDGGRR